MIILIDNYDSFSYNLFQLIGSIDPDIRVIRNDDMTSEEVLAMKPRALILSPGPGRPENAGICVDLIRKAKGTVPILGVCLGHQAIALAYGAKVTYAKELMHGKSSEAKLDTSSPVFRDLPERISVARYHSLAADADTFPGELRVTARTDDGEVMAISHREYPVFGLQFHPESILTPEGKNIVNNFLMYVKGGTEK
ncbi:MAG: aminodeoxychorismate/anthranilate synthase component II [Lachnospiraceae bacterium]|nr:aminodeoxychorismate/anthranilate synthase component II [Lachnospiraceae bacterium]